MRILIIEDEKSQINKLKCFFEDSFPEFTIDYAPTYHEARIKIIESNFDIGIFDILLKDKLIFEILDGVNFDTKEIIFLTGDHSYTHKAFECYAIDYILKPYDSRYNTPQLLDQKVSDAKLIFRVVLSSILV